MLVRVYNCISTEQNVIPGKLLLTYKLDLGKVCCHSVLVCIPLVCTVQSVNQLTFIYKALNHIQMASQSALHSQRENHLIKVYQD